MHAGRSLGHGWNAAARACRCAGSGESRRKLRIVVFVGIAIAMMAAPAFAGEASMRADREYWESRYRELVADVARLRGVVERERELYADANRRNYRRGNKRHVHREAATKAAEELAKVEAQLATIEDDARRAGAPRGWLNQIEIELEDAARHPAVSAGPGDDGRNPAHLKSRKGERSDRNSADRNEGRNPLYLE